MEPAHRALIPRPPPGGGLSSPAQRSSTEIDKNAERRFIVVHTTGLSARKGLLSTSLVLVSFTLFTAAMFAGGKLADSMQQARDTATFAEIHQQSFEPVYYREVGVARLFAAVQDKRLLRDFCRQTLAHGVFNRSREVQDLKATLEKNDGTRPAGSTAPPQPA